MKTSWQACGSSCSTTCQRRRLGAAPGAVAKAAGGCRRCLQRGRGNRSRRGLARACREGLARALPGIALARGDLAGSGQRPTRHDAGHGGVVGRRARGAATAAGPKRPSAAARDGRRAVPTRCRCAGGGRDPAPPLVPVRPVPRAGRGPAADPRPQAGRTGPPRRAGRRPCRAGLPQPARRHRDGRPPLVPLTPPTWRTARPCGRSSLPSAGADWSATTGQPRHLGSLGPRSPWVPCCSAASSIPDRQTGSIN
jgi:hypothetical protein